MASSYRGSVEVGPHWCSDVFFESVADAKRVGDELVELLRFRQRLFAANPGLLAEAEPELGARQPTKEEYAASKRAEEAKGLTRCAEIWAEIMPAVRDAMLVVEQLPVNHRIWMLTMLAGETLTRMSTSNQDAQVRADYLRDFMGDMIASTFATRPKATGVDPL